MGRPFAPAPDSFETKGRYPIKAQRLVEEVFIRVPRAPDVKEVSEMAFLDIAGKKLSIVVLPPLGEYTLGAGFRDQDKDYDKDGVKVINGKLTWTTESGDECERGIAVDPYSAKSLLLNAVNNTVKAGPNGAIFIRLASSRENPWTGEKFTNIEQVGSVNCFPDSHAVNRAVCNLEFKWVPANDRPWANDGEFHESFHNLVGFHVVYDDDSLTSFCHIQAWTLGIGQTAKFHNHSDKAFCEIHACIVNGTGKGGMWWAKDEESNQYLENNRGQLEHLQKYANPVYVKNMEEHGPLWRMNGKYPKFRDNGTVDYPYHAWIAGPAEAGQTEESLDIWIAFEFPPTEFQSGVSKFCGCTPAR